MTALSKLKKKDITYGPGGKKRKNPTKKREAHEDAGIISAKPHSTLAGQVASLERWVNRYKKDNNKKKKI